MSDVDGTLVPYDYQALPSDRVAAAVKKAQEKIVVCLVSGRGYGSLIPVMEKLSLTTGYGVFNNGALVVDLSSKELIYDKPLNFEDATEIISLFHREQIPFYLKQEVLEPISLELRSHHSNKTAVSKPYMLFTEEIFSLDEVESIAKKLSHMTNITFHKGHHKTPNKYSLNISHGTATKLHGIGVIQKKLHLKTEEIIGIGDSYNDFPLLMACGLKIAMGNAVPDLKAIADFIAPSVTDDGVATVIEKYILQK
jgi:Cof subfamily protein (haloacid dehalogenase superfamily)